MVSGDSGLWLIDAKTGTRRSLAGSDFSGSLIAWSPEGRQLAFKTDRPGAFDAFATVDVKSGHVHLIAATKGEAVIGAVRWSPDGKQIAFERCDDIFERCDLLTVDSAGSRPRRIARIHWDVGDGFDWGRS
jgi:Tol biopolymer transport system component